MAKRRSRAIFRKTNKIAAQKNAAFALMDTLVRNNTRYIFANHLDNIQRIQQL